jgi:hypothetical protein
MSNEWYNREREYKEGCYINGRGYYNEDTNRWVSRLTKKVIVEKYIRYEFSIYDDRDIEREFGWENIDRVGKFLFLLYKSGLEIGRLKGSRFVFVDTSNLVLGILGSKYKEIVRRLDEELNIIDIRKGKGLFGKTKIDYKLHDEFFEDTCFRRKVFIRNSRLIRFLDRYNGKVIGLNKYLLWEFDVCKRLDLVYNIGGLNKIIEKRLNNIKINDYEQKDWDFESKRKRKNKNIGWDDLRSKDYLDNCRSSLKLLELDIESAKNDVINFKGFGSDDNFSGRISNIINNKEKEFRKFLKIDRENLIEFDMVNGYVSLLYRIFRGIRDEEHVESSFFGKIKECLGDLNGNDFIEKYSICFEGDVDKRIDFYKKVGLDLGKIENIIDRSYFKGLILYLINGEESDGRRKTYIDDEFEYDDLMTKVFGKGGFSVLSKLKNSVLDFRFGKKYYGFESYKNMSKILMYMEVQTMKGIWDIMITNKIDYISLYDGMLIKKSDKSSVKRIVETYLTGKDDCISMKFKN